MKGATATALTVSSLLSTAPVMANEEVKDQNLQSKVDMTSHDVQNAKQEMDKALQEKKAVEKEEVEAQAAYNQAQKALQEQQLKNDQYLVDQLQEKVDILEKNDAQTKKEVAKLKSLQEKQKQNEEDLQKAQDNKAQLEKELQQLQEQLESVTPEELQKAKEAVVQAQAQVDALQADADACNKAYAEQKEVVDTLTLSQTQAQKEYEQAVAEKNEAQKSLDLAKARLDQAQKNLAGYESGAITTDAQKALDDAKNQWNTANEQLELAKQKEVQTKDELQNAKNQTIAAKTKMDEAQDLLVTKQGQLDKKNKEHEVLLQNVEEYKKTYDQDLQTYNKAEQDVSSKKQELSKCLLLINSCSSDIEDLDVDIQQQQELVNDAQAEYNRISKLTSKDFFAYFEQADALKVFENVTENTVLGDPNDATSLQNMKLALQELKVLNQIREKENVSPIYVTSKLMAQSQIQTNESSHTHQHSKLYYISENLMWGVRPDQRSAYESWYTYEKELFNDFVNETPELKDLRDQGFNDFQMREYLSESQYNQVGHYLNTVNPNYRLAGSSFNSSGIPTIGNVYADHNWGSDKVLTVEEYEELLDEYMTMNNLEKAKAVLDESIQILNKQKDNLASLNQNAIELNAQKIKLEKELSDLQGVAQDAKQTKEASEKIYKGANQKAAESLSQIEADRLVVENLQKQYDQIQENEYLPAVDREKKAKKAYEDAVANHLQKEEDVKKAKANVHQKEAKLKEVIDEFEKNKAVAKQEVADATVALKQTDQTYDASLKKANQAKKDLDLANQSLKQAQQELTDSEVKKEASLQSLTQAQNALVAAQDQVDTMESAFQSLEEKKAANADCQKEMDTLTNQVNANADAIMKSKLDLNMMEQIKNLTNAAISELNDKKEIWQSIVAGGDEVLDDGSEWSQNVEAFKELRKVVAEKKAVLLEVRDRVEKKRQVYAKAKNEYEEAKKVLEAAKKALKDYVDAVHPVVKEDVSTSVFTNKTALSALSAISLAGFVLTFAKSKREE